MHCNLIRISPFFFFFKKQKKIHFWSIFSILRSKLCPPTDKSGQNQSFWLICDQYPTVWMQQTRFFPTPTQVFFTWYLQQIGNISDMLWHSLRLNSPISSNTYVFEVVHRSIQTLILPVPTLHCLKLGIHLILSYRIELQLHHLF